MSCTHDASDVLACYPIYSRCFSSIFRHSSLPSECDACHGLPEVSQQGL